MKIPFFSRWVFAAALVLLIVWVPPGSGTLRAQDETTNNSTSSTTYDSTGKVTAISAPLTITVNSRRGPFTYQIAPDVYVYTASRKPGTIRDVHVGQTVTVYYYKRIGQETVARVVILKTAPAAK